MDFLHELMQQGYFFQTIADDKLESLVVPRVFKHRIFSRISHVNLRGAFVFGIVFNGKRCQKSSGPTILTVAADVRFFPNRPPLLARGSKVLASIVESKQAGRLFGKARLRMTLNSILTSDLCEYPIDAKIIEAGRQKVEENVIQETPQLQTPPARQQRVERTPSDICFRNPASPARVLVNGSKVTRPIRNLTPYHVSVYLNRTPITILPPCFGPSMIETPPTEFRLEVVASMLTGDTQGSTN